MFDCEHFKALEIITRATELNCIYPSTSSLDPIENVSSTSDVEVVEIVDCPRLPLFPSVNEDSVDLLIDEYPPPLVNKTLSEKENKLDMMSVVTLVDMKNEQSTVEANTAVLATMKSKIEKMNRTLKVPRSLRKVYATRKKPRKSARQQAKLASSPQLYCYCQLPDNEGRRMIGCDGRDCILEWYHFECVGITVPPKSKWFCRDCRSQKKPKREWR